MIGELFVCIVGVDIDDGETPVVLETLRRGTWADSEVERIVKLTLQFGRKHHVPDTIQEGGVLHVKLFEVYKKEFRQLRVVWRQMNDQASAIDELSMATLRLRLRLPHELPGKIESNVLTFKSLLVFIQFSSRYIDSFYDQRCPDEYV